MEFIALLREVLAGEGGALVALVSAGAIHGAWQGHAEGRRRQFDTKAQQLILGLLTSSDPADAKAELERWPLAAQVRTLDLLERSLAGQASVAEEIARHLGLEQRALRLCSSRSWRSRLKGVRLASVWGGLAGLRGELLGDRHPLVRAEVASWSAGDLDPLSLRRLFSMLADRDGYSRFAAQDALLSAGRAIVEPLAEYLANVSVEAGNEAVVPCLEIAAAVADPRLLAPAFRWCGEAIVEARAAAARLVGTIGGEEAARKLQDLLEDPEGSVVARAAESLGRLRFWPAAGQLAGLLRSRQWEVRRAAALALRQLGSPGQILLRQALRDADAFAADMARQVLDLPPVVAG